MYLLYFAGFVLFSCGHRQRFQLVVKNASLFNVHTKQVEPNRTVLIDKGRITRIIDSKKMGGMSAYTVIDAKGKLLTPGFFDVHFHSLDILGDSCSMQPDSIARYQKIFASEFLPYGVTGVRDAGSPEKYLPMLQTWMRPTSNAPDYYPCGGALVTYDSTRKTYFGHAAVKDSLEAVQKVQEYHDLGIRQIKLYWRLQENEFRSALKKAEELNMNAFGHIDNGVVSIQKALELGLKNFEHAFTLGREVLDSADFETIFAEVEKKWGGSYFSAIMEYFNYLGENNPKMMALLDKLKQRGASVTPTLHVFGQPLGLSYFSSPPAEEFLNTSKWPKKQLDRANSGYKILASYVRIMHEKGIRLNTGTDSKDPGKAVLSEMLLLNEAGISMPDVLTIATLNSATSIAVDTICGSIEAGKKANLILFEKNPFDDPKNLLSMKTVIKDGIVWKN
jgi:imidazolonepropionase-like amidohydrolase